MHIHENRPGVLTALNKIFAEQGVNIAAQYLQTSAQMGYVVIDIEADEDVAEKALQAMKLFRVPFAPVCCTNSPSLKINGQVTDLPVFLSLLHTVAALRILLCESAPENKSKSDQCVVFYLMGIYDGGTAWGCNGKALTEARA